MVDVASAVLSSATLVGCVELNDSAADGELWRLPAPTLMQDMVEPVDALEEERVMRDRLAMLCVGLSAGVL